MRKACQGYCGGYVTLDAGRRVGPDAELFCERCYGLWLRRQYVGWDDDE